MNFYGRNKAHFSFAENFNRLIIGIIFGFAIGPVVPTSPILGNYVMPFIDLVGKIFLRLLMMLIVPLVFASLVAGAASVGDIHKLGRIGIKTLALYLVTTAIAIVLGLACGNLFQPGVGMNIPGGLSASAREAKPIADVILDIFPSNPLASMVNANMLQIIVFALFFGVACIMAGDRGKKISDFFEGVAEVMYQVVHVVVNIRAAKTGGFQRSLAKPPLFAGAGLRSLYPVKSEDLSDYLLSFQIVFTERLTVFHLRYV